MRNINFIFSPSSIFINFSFLPKWLIFNEKEHSNQLYFNDGKSILDEMNILNKKIKILKEVNKDLQKQIDDPKNTEPALKIENMINANRRKMQKLADSLAVIIGKNQTIH